MAGIVKWRSNPGLRDAIAAIGVDGIARACIISDQAVSQWTSVPARRVAAVAKASGIPPWKLRPDLYPKDLFKNDHVMRLVSETIANEVGGGADSN